MRIRWQQRTIPALLILWLAASCGGPTAGTITPQPTVTPLDAGAAAREPIGSSGAAQADLKAAQAAIDAGKFADAVKLLQHAGPATTDSAPLLAAAYLGWGRALLRNTAAGPSGVELARERFVSGLAQAPDAGQPSKDLRDEIARADTYADAALVVEQLKQQLDAGQTGPASVAAPALLARLDQLKQQLADYPPLPALAYEGYLHAGDALRDGGQQEQALAAYQQASAISGVDTSAALSRIAALQQTPTPAPEPTARPTPVPALVVVPDVRGSDPGQAKSYLESFGFKVALTQITDQSQLGGLCKQQVSYTAPAGGQRARKGSLVRVFYRGFDSFPSPADCPPGR